MTEERESADLPARYDAEGMADELLRRWLEDPDAAEKWARLADHVQVDDEGE